MGVLDDDDVASVLIFFLWISQSNSSLIFTLSLQLATGTVYMTPTCAPITL